MTAGEGVSGASEAIVDDPDNHRFVYRDGSEAAELVYRRNGRRLVLIHTGVPESLSGRGLGGRLVATAVEEARSQGLTLVPDCPFALRWLEQHPELAADVSIDWPGGTLTPRVGDRDPGARGRHRG
jgi:uncharacterized protein